MGQSLASGVDPVVIAAPSRGSKKVPSAITDPRDGPAALLSLALGCPGITLSLAPAHFFQCLFHTVFHGINVVLSEAMYPVHKALRVIFFRRHVPDKFSPCTEKDDQNPGFDRVVPKHPSLGHRRRVQEQDRRMRLQEVS